MSGHDRLYSFKLSQALATVTDRREGYSRSEEDCGVPLQNALLTGGDKPYAFVLSDEVNAPELHTTLYVTFLKVNLGSGRKKRLIN